MSICKENLRIAQVFLGRWRPCCRLLLLAGGGAADAVFYHMVVVSLVTLNYETLLFWHKPDHCHSERIRQ